MNLHMKKYAKLMKLYQFISLETLDLSEPRVLTFHQKIFHFIN